LDRPSDHLKPALDRPVERYQLREDSFFPALLEPHRRIDRALLAVAMEAYVHALSSAAASLGLDLDGHVSGSAKTLLFAPTALAAWGDGPGEGADGSTGGGEAPAGETVPTSMPTVFRTRAVTTSSGTFGHIRIFTFSVQDPVAFMNEFIRLIGLLPQDGLAIDVGDNGGGHIYASEFTLHENFPIAGRSGPARPEPQGGAGTRRVAALFRPYLRRRGEARPGTASLDRGWRPGVSAAVVMSHRATLTC
jgi:hypothetical protein